MATFVLIHGSWEGGWIWHRTVPHLRAAGHEVFTPSLTGLGERSHLMNPSIDLDTHIADILGVLKWERLENITLVGHSYAGMVATGVADRAHERLGSLIYLDAFMPKDGQAVLDLQPPERAAELREVAERQGEGWYLPLLALPALRHVTDPEEAPNGPPIHTSPPPVLRATPMLVPSCSPAVEPSTIAPSPNRTRRT